MKKSFLVLPALMMLVNAAKAETCTPNPYPYQPIKPTIQTGDFVMPSDIKRMLDEVRQRREDQRMMEILGEPALKSLEEYSKLKDGQVNANYVAVAVAGIAVAAIEYAWDRYVGNGPKNKIDIDDQYFDPNRPIVVPPKVIPWRPKPIAPPQGVIPLYGVVPHQGVVPYQGGNNPVALTPVVAEAVVFGLAYKAAEYSMKKAFGQMEGPQNIRPDEFDLGNLRNIQQRGY